MPAVGDLVPLTDGRWMTWPPKRCPNGHQLGGGRSTVGHAPCSCGGHTTWCCSTCDAVTYGPALSGGCTVLIGPAAVRNV